jgi:hypothetical protein
MIDVWRLMRDFSRVMCLAVQTTQLCSGHQQMFAMAEPQIAKI